MDADVIIIGAGYGGLATGALLAKKGKKVLIFESEKVVGGRAKNLSRDGFTIDYGFHANRFGKAGPAARVLRELGQKIDFVKKKNLTSYIYRDGRLFPQPDSPRKFLTTRLLTLPSKLKLIRILLALVHARPDQWYDKSLLQFLEQYSLDPALKDAFRFFGCAITCLDIEEASAGEMIDFIQKAAKTVLVKKIVAEPVGGTKQILQKLTSAIGRNGKIRLGCKVDQILVRHKRVVGVLAGGKEYKSWAVVYTPPIQNLFEIIDKDYFPPEFIKYAQDLEPTSGVSIDFGLKESITDMEGNILWLNPPIGQAILGSFPSNSDPALAPRGRQLASWLLIMPSPSIKERGEVKHAFNQLRGFIKELFPRFFELVEWERELVLPIMDGVKLKVGQAYPDRHDLQSPYLRGLFFAGDTAKGRGCGGDIAFDSALRCSRILYNLT